MKALALLALCISIILWVMVKTAYVTGKHDGVRQAVQEQQQGRKLQDSIDSVAVTTFYNHSAICK